MEENKIIKIAIIGAESTGKSSLAIDLATHFNTAFVSEYAREYFNTHDIDNYTLDVLDNIYSTQIDNENKILQEAKGFLFCDTTLITAKIWCEEVFGKTTEFVNNNLTKVKYDLYLVMDNDVPWEKDMQRKNPHNRKELFDKNIKELKKLNARYEIVNGLKEQRLRNAIDHINKVFGIN